MGATFNPLNQPDVIFQIWCVGVGISLIMPLCPMVHMHSYTHAQDARIHIPYTHNANHISIMQLGQSHVFISILEKRAPPKNSRMSNI